MTEPLLTPLPRSRRARLADWLGLNRATVAVLVIIGCLGLSEEIWSNFVSLALNEKTNLVAKTVMYVGLIGFARNLLEGFGYIIGGTVAHRMGARLALAFSAIPMAIGVAIMLSIHSPWAIVFGSLLMTNWEPLSVPATFDVVGSEVPKNRRTIAFAVQSIQKRLPKVIGPAVGGAVFAFIGFAANLTIAFALVAFAVILQLALTKHMRPKSTGAHVPVRDVLRQMPRELKLLLSAEIFIRWGDWFVRDFAALYVMILMTTRFGWSDATTKETIGFLIALTSTTALLTYIPVAKWVDRSPSPKPFIGLTFFLFAIFPIGLVTLPRLAAWAGVPAMAGLILAYTFNGLREIGEPARKALISTGFPPEVRARAVGIYWGARSFAFCLAPLVAAALWTRLGPDTTFLIGGSIGLLGTLWYAISSRTLSTQ